MKDKALTFLLRMLRSLPPEGGEAEEVRRGLDICTPHSSYLTAVIISDHRLWTSRPSCKPRESHSSPTRSTSSDSVGTARSEEHTSELQSRQYLVCRLLLEKKKKKPPSTSS